MIIVRDDVLMLKKDKFKNHLDFSGNRMYNTTEINTGELVVAG